MIDRSRLVELLFRWLTDRETDRALRLLACGRLRSLSQVIDLDFKPLILLVQLEDEDPEVVQAVTDFLNSMAKDSLELFPFFMKSLASWSPIEQLRELSWFYERQSQIYLTEEVMQHSGVPWEDVPTSSLTLLVQLLRQANDFIDERPQDRGIGVCWDILVNAPKLATETLDALTVMWNDSIQSRMTEISVYPIFSVWENQPNLPQEVLKSLLEILSESSGDDKIDHFSSR